MSISNRKNLRKKKLKILEQSFRDVGGFGGRVTRTQEKLISQLKIKGLSLSPATTQLKIIHRER